MNRGIKIFLLVLSCILFTIKGHVNEKDYFFNISLGIINTRTVIACGSIINIYSSFDLIQILTCPYVTIQQNNIKLINMKIFNEEKLNINLSSQLINPPKLMIKLVNNSFIYSSNLTLFNMTYYISFSSELMCRYSFLKNITICFYYPLSINFIDIENYFDKRILHIQIRKRFIIIFIIITILILIISCFALYILCSNRSSYHHMIQLDNIIDPQLARQAALKLAPEPVA